MVDKEYIIKNITLKVGQSERLVEISKYLVRPYVKPLKIPIYHTHYDLFKERTSPVLEPYKEVIREWLEQDQSAPPKQTHTARRIYHRLVDEYGFTGGESTVRSFVRKEKNGHLEMFIPLIADWGEQVQVDWGRAKVYLGR